jgi:hypothetical protein
MLAVRLVKLIENHTEQLSRELSEQVWNSPRCSDLHKVPATELQPRTREIYRNLCDWLQDKAETEVERRYTELGARRAQQGVAYSHVFWAITATKQHVYGFIQREGLSDNALYYIALGFEQERDRIGGKQRRRKGDE